MASDIKTQIENINNSLAWIRRHHPEHYEQRFLQLVEERRKLRKIAEAEKDNPAIAAGVNTYDGKVTCKNLADSFDDVECADIKALV